MQLLSGSHWLKEPNAAEMPLKVVHKAQQNWRCILSALQVSYIDARSFLCLQGSFGLRNVSDQYL